MHTFYCMTLMPLTLLFRCCNIFFDAVHLEYGEQCGPAALSAAILSDEVTGEHTASTQIIHKTLKQYIMSYQICAVSCMRLHVTPLNVKTVPHLNHRSAAIEFCDRLKRKRQELVRR